MDVILLRSEKEPQTVLYWKSYDEWFGKIKKRKTNVSNTAASTSSNNSAVNSKMNSHTYIYMQSHTITFVVVVVVGL